MARIPIAPDVAALVGDFAEGVQNRSLLYEKFSFHKSWGLDGLKHNDAHRWSILRIADGGGDILQNESSTRRRQADGRNVEPHNRERLLREADLAAALARTSAHPGEVQDLAVSRTKMFMAQFTKAMGQRGRILLARLEGRLALNLANGLIQNAGICLERHLGTPYIPGSALKGIARDAAAQLSDAAMLEAVFGSVQQRGGVSFLDAWPVSPSSVRVDLTNVHFPDYYKSGRVADLKTEKPLPNPFPVIEAGAEFAFFLAADCREDAPRLLDFAEKALASALQEHGVGAKTASGYGWFSMVGDRLLEILAEADAAEQAEMIRRQAVVQEAARIEAERQRQAALSPEDLQMESLSKLRDEDFAKKATEINALPEPEQKALLRLLLVPPKRESWKTWKKSDKPASKARVEALRNAAQKHGISLP
jgi:CRISPR/Cas system CMR subunit Cmr6 (Cas7 group RAMP superfamily)